MTARKTGAHRAPLQESLDDGKGDQEQASHRHRKEQENRCADIGEICNSSDEHSEPPNAILVRPVRLGDWPLVGFGKCYLLPGL